MLYWNKTSYINNSLTKVTIHKPQEYIKVDWILEGNILSSTFIKYET